MISIALSFDSGILFCAAAKNSVPARMYFESTNIFPRQYGAKSGDACSIFLLSEPIDCAVAAVQYCEHALDILQPAEFTIDRMRATIETSLSEIYERQPGVTMLVALYSSSDRQYSAFRTSGAALKDWPVTTVKVARRIRPLFDPRSIQSHAVNGCTRPAIRIRDRGRDIGRRQGFLRRMC